MKKLSQKAKIEVVKCKKCGTQIATFSWMPDYKKVPESCRNCK